MWSKCVKPESIFHFDHVINTNFNKIIVISDPFHTLFTTSPKSKALWIFTIRILIYSPSTLDSLHFHFHFHFTELSLHQAFTFRIQISSPSSPRSPSTSGSTSSPPISPSLSYSSPSLILGLHLHLHLHHYLLCSDPLLQWFSARVRSQWGRRSVRMMRRGSVWQGRVGTKRQKEEIRTQIRWKILMQMQF